MHDKLTAENAAPEDLGLMYQTVAGRGKDTKQVKRIELVTADINTACSQQMNAGEGLEVTAAAMTTGNALYGKAGGWDQTMYRTAVAEADPKRLDLAMVLDFRLEEIKRMAKARGHADALAEIARQLQQAQAAITAFSGDADKRKVVELYRKELFTLQKKYQGGPAGPAANGTPAAAEGKA